MEVEIRPLTPADREAGHVLRVTTFTARSAAAARHEFHEADHEQDFIADDRRLGAFAGDELVGHAGAWEVGQFFGGARVPMGGVAGVAVRPDWRGRGVGGRLMRAQLELLRERGDAVSTLFPATTSLYRRYGWEIAGARPARTVATRTLAELPPPDGEVTVEQVGTEALPEVVAVYGRVAPTRDGHLDRSEARWRRQLAELDTQPEHLVLARTGGRATGYLHYRRTETEGHAPHALRVTELVAATRDAELALWAVLARSASVADTVTYQSPPEDPLLLLLPEQDLRLVAGDWRWMTRLVDAPAAVAARGYPEVAPVEVPLEIADELAPWNAGRWVLSVRDGRGKLDPGGDGRVRADIGALASLYTGWARPHDLARLRRLEGATEADLAALDRAFRGPTPWMLEFF